MQVTSYCALVVEDAFVNLQSRENQCLRPTRESSEHRVELLPIPNSRSSTLDTQFQQNVQPQPTLVKEAAELIRVLGRVDQAIELEVSVFQHLRDRGHVLLAYELVRHQHAPDSVLVGDASLVSRCQCDTPCSSIDLPLEEPGRHRCFAVRRQLHTIGTGECLHPFQIMIEFLR